MTKSQTIYELFAENPDLRPKDVSAILESRGYPASKALVSRIFYQDYRNGSLVGQKAILIRKFLDCKYPNTVPERKDLISVEEIRQSIGYNKISHTHVQLVRTQWYRDKINQPAPPAKPKVSVIEIAKRLKALHQVVNIKAVLDNLAEINDIVGKFGLEQTKELFDLMSN